MARFLQHCSATLAWSALLATTLVLASLFQALASTALVVPERAPLPAAQVSEATTALADGDDVRARFLRNVPAETLAATPVSCSAPPTDGKACIS